MLFSDGDGGAPAPVVAGVVVVVVVVVVSGAFSSLAQAAVIAPIAMIADRPEMATRRRPKRRESMVRSYLCPNPDFSCGLAVSGGGGAGRLVGLLVAGGYGKSPGVAPVGGLS